MKDFVAKPRRVRRRLGPYSKTTSLTEGAAGRMNYLEALDHPEFFGRWFGAASWAAWRTIEAAIFGLPVPDLDTPRSTGTGDGSALCRVPRPSSTLPANSWLERV